LLSGVLLSNGREPVKVTGTFTPTLGDEAKSLDTCNAKRDFCKTLKPPGRPAAKAGLAHERRGQGVDLLVGSRDLKL
jgi:hypothetical protein